MHRPNLIKGGNHTDNRGTIHFVNDFLLDDVKRFYLIHHPDTEVIRAWQGNKIEQKWFYVVEGAFKVITVQPGDWQNPSNNKLSLEEFDLGARNNEILHVPAGYANGFKALVPGSKVIVYSNIYIHQAADDDFRFPKEYWYDWKNLKAL